MKMYKVKTAIFSQFHFKKNIRNRAMCTQPIMPIGTFKYADIKPIAVPTPFFSMDLNYMDTASLQQRKKENRIEGILLYL